MHNVTFKPLAEKEEDSQKDASPKRSSKSADVIYQNMEEWKFNQINSISLESSLGSKIDMSEQLHLSSVNSELTTGSHQAYPLA